MTTPRRPLRSRLSLLVLSLAFLSAPSSRAAEPRVVRVGFQKYGTLTLLKARGLLEKRLARDGVQVTWTEFPAGPQLLEALNVGAIDFGTVGEAPPIFAQAAGADLVYLANEPPAPAGEAIVVPKDSPLRSVADLKGKRIALNKGSNVHYLLVRALEHAGVAYADVQTVFLPPADARAAFEKGAVDAWAIWDPFLAAAEAQLSARKLTDGTGLVQNHQFFLAARRFAEREPAVVSAIVEELAANDAWAKAHPDEVASALSPLVGLDAATLRPAAVRAGYGTVPVSEAVLAEQQRIADVFHTLKLVPARVDVRRAVLPTRPAVR